MQKSDIAVPMKNLRIPAEIGERNSRQEPSTAISAPYAHYGFDLWVQDGTGQVLEPLHVRSGQIAIFFEDIFPRTPPRIRPSGGFAPPFRTDRFQRNSTAQPVQSNFPDRGFGTQVYRSCDAHAGFLFLSKIIFRPLRVRYSSTASMSLHRLQSARPTRRWL